MFLVLLLIGDDNEILLNFGFQGFTHKKINGECCGKCVQSSCILNNTVLIKPGILWRPPGDNCTCYECEPNTFIVIKRIMSCPEQKPVECEKGILVNVTSTDGCCTLQYCEPRKCDVMKSWKIIESGECSANVTLNNCEGYCSSVSRHPNFPKMEEHDCTCCQASKTITKNIQLQCTNGKTIGYTFTDILKCACKGAACVFTE
ncbi:intestinal mucin-like protein [Pseudophryne corroboree]|uniref:intestinal mucin-like protein n=1 Tax=Pseudophryne corroboree TaxID=495146 RepID=UPI00308128B8